MEDQSFCTYTRTVEVLNVFEDIMPNTFYALPQLVEVREGWRVDKSGWYIHDERDVHVRVVGELADRSLHTIEEDALIYFSTDCTADCQYKSSDLVNFSPIYSKSYA